MLVVQKSQTHLLVGSPKNLAAVSLFQRNDSDLKKHMCSLKKSLEGGIGKAKSINYTKQTFHRESFSFLFSIVNFLVQ